MPNSHCSKCGKYKCKDGHVYVIELEESALDCEKFARDFNRDDFKSGITKCLYVGETTHAPQCRYNQHVANRNKHRKIFICKCNKGEVRVPFSPFNKASPIAHKYSKKGGLRPKMYKDYNPVKGNQEKRKKVEKELSESLRKQGHAVHYG